LTLFVVTGSVVISVGQSQQALERGAVLLVPMGEEHGIENRTREPATVLGVLQLRGAGESAGRPSDGNPTASAVVVDCLQALAATNGDGVVWTLDGPSELSVDLVRLEPDQSIEEDRNDGVDVLLVALAGMGELLVDGLAAPLELGVVAHVPRGSMRSVHAGEETLRYLSVRRRRVGPAVRPRPIRRPSRARREYGVTGGITGAEATDGEGSGA
jgi:quercetin dioxygenase-like cupin family protein